MTLFTSSQIRDRSWQQITELFGVLVLQFEDVMVELRLLFFFRLRRNFLQDNTLLSVSAAVLIG